MSELPLLEPGTDPDEPVADHDGPIFGVDEPLAGADEPFADRDGEPGPDAAVARRARRTRWLLIGGIAAVLLVVVSLLVTWRLTAGPHTRLTAPNTVAGLHRDTAADATQTADYLRNAIAADASLTDTVGAVYGDPAAPQHEILIFGGTGDIKAPDARLTSAFGLLDDQTGSMTGIQSLPAGPLGGVLRCGTSNGDGAPITACGWADEGSLVLGLFPGRTIDQAAGLMRDLRGAMEHPG